MFSEILIGACAELRKVIINFVLPVRLSVCPQGTVWLLLDRFIRNSMINNFSKICRENSSFIKI